MPTNPIWKIGDPVVLWSDSRNPRCVKEYGIVVGMKWDRKQQWWDCRVMFFGNKWPTFDGFKKTDPYFLRYLETSLRRYTPKKGKLTR